MFNDLISSTLYPNGHDSRQFSALVYGIALTMRAKMMLDLGVRDGGFTAPLIAAAETIPGCVVSVDIVDPTFKSDSRSWQFVNFDSLEYLADARKRQRTFDLISIDDLHKEDHVVDEIFAALNVLSPTGIIMMHDTMHSGSHPEYNLSEHRDGVFEGRGPAGALQIVLEVRDDLEFFTFPVSHGLTIVRRVIGRTIR